MSELEIPDPVSAVPVYTCNECGSETIFAGLCSDCQLWAGRAIPDIVADFQAIVHASEPRDESQ